MEKKVQSMVVANVKNPPPIEPIRNSLTKTTYTGDVMPFGYNNLFPNELAGFLRRSKLQRGILNDKSAHYAGAYFVSESEQFLDWEKNAGRDDVKGQSISFFEVHKRLISDKRQSGNAYLHLITDARKSFILFQHLDYTRCRVNKYHEVVYNQDWYYRLNSEKDKILPLFPVFTRNAKMFGDELYHSVMHFKDYEPEFVWYGIPDWITGWENMLIDVRTDEWNLSHIDTGVKPDVIMHLPAGISELELKEIKDNAKDFKEGKPGSLLFTFGDNVKSTVLTNQVFDMDWEKLTNANLEKALIANSWYKSLMSVSQSTGFDTERVKYEYQLALRKIIPEQEIFMMHYRNILDQFGIDTESLQIHNEPILPELSEEDRLIKMLPFFSEQQKAEIAQRYFDKFMSNE